MRSDVHPGTADRAQIVRRRAERQNGVDLDAEGREALAQRFDVRGDRESRAAKGPMMFTDGRSVRGESVAK